jgi:hypothetical protein
LQLFQENKRLKKQLRNAEPEVYEVMIKTKKEDKLIRKENEELKQKIEELTKEIQQLQKISLQNNPNVNNNGNTSSIPSSPHNVVASSSSTPFPSRKLSMLSRERPSSANFRDGAMSPSNGTSFKNFA